MTVRRLLGFAAAAAALAVAALVFVPTGYYLFVPNTAKPLQGLVQVEGEKPQDDEGGIYYVDVTVRPANWFERLLAFVRPNGASIVPEAELVPPGSTRSIERRASLDAMARSEEVAAAVALEQAGYDVTAEPRGTIVEAVAADVPAVRVLRSGDVIVEAGGKPVRTPVDLREAVAAVDPGQSVALRVRREGKALDLTVPTIDSPSDPGRPMIGIRIAQAAEIDLPLDVKIDLGDVGGPSAGLPFALDILQSLGTDIDRGHTVVATGEIELDGTVGSIGGVKQKVFGAKAAGADVMLVPAGDNAAEARRYAGNLRVIAVETFQQALRKLATLRRK
ncbi:MAG: PDZ domain-containing protein [Thermoleophilia bacterium]|nr:PDZ domain-containing protein [Thermoleophilia bacterium]MDH5333513.1 PDZ domain-containing protein [Thermoleophilia bacterium]